MANLTANQRSFIEMMQMSDEHAIRGFDLLLKRPQFLEFIDPLIAAGLFAPEKNPAPVQADKEGSYRIPYWKALDYLVACAKVAGENNDVSLADKILTIIRTVSAERDAAGDRANYFTFRRFAEILGLLPTSAIKPSDVALVEGWLTTRFDDGMVANAIDDGALPRFLNSSTPADWDKAVQLFGYCTAIRWQPDRLNPETQEPVTVVEEHWLRDLVEKHATTVGRRAGASAAPLMAGRVLEVFGKGGRADWSHVFRPAVEGEGQNHVGRGPENIVVEALRDVLAGWTESDALVAKPFVGELLRSGNEMLRRIGIHILNERWESLRELFPPLIGPDLFVVDHLHELHRLLNMRFESFSDEEKSATIDALRNVPVPVGDEDAAARVERLQFRWLTAVAGTAYAPAANWLEELNRKHGPPPKHPDYLSRIETRWGPGPSQYGADELVALAEDRTLAEKLAAFKPSNSWEGPTVEALTDQLERAVRLSPIVFVRVLPDLLTASITYRHAVIAGFLKLWREPNAERPFDGWNEVWPKLFDFFEALLANPTFWNEKGAAHRSLEVTPMWIAASIADLLHAGTRDDDHAYLPTLLPRGWAVLHTLLAHSEAVSEPSDDPMFQAINSTRGRSLEAVFSHALRVCRLADQETGSHAAEWTRMQPLFDTELASCINANFEFSTLSGAYSGNLEYLSADWLETNFKGIFPLNRPSNLICAIGGLAYASTSRKLYRLLRDNAVLDAALQLEIKGRNGREKLLERVAVGYLWGEDTLDSSRFRGLFESRAEEDLSQMNFFFWTLRDEGLTEDQIQRIIEYWRHCLKWAADQPTPPVKVLSSLSGLASFLPNAAGNNRALLLGVAPHVHAYHGSYDFLKELGRLVEGSPKEVCEVLRTFTETHEPMYDYEGRMRTLVARLAELGHRAEAIAFCDKLRSLPGLYELFLELTSTPPKA